MLGCLLALLLAPFTATLRGYVLQQLWLWFLVPLGLAPIGIAHAIGISVLVTLLTFQMVKDPFDDMETETQKVIARSSIGVLLSLVCWGFGAIALLFM